MIVERNLFIQETINQLKAMMQETEQIRELVDRAKQMDMEAFGQIYELFYKRIYKYAYFKTANDSDAEDLTAQVFIGAMKTIRNFSWRNASFASWLYRIAHNMVVDYWRKQGRTATKPLDDLNDLDDGKDVAETVMVKLKCDQLKEALAVLPEEQAQVIMLRFISGFNVNETAAAMGKSVAAIKSQQFRGLEKLRGLLGNSNDE